MSTSNKRRRLNLQQTAQARADISAMLSKEPGSEFTAKDIADKLGISPHSAGHILAGMARGSLIAPPNKHSGKTWWSWPMDKPLGEAEEPAAPTRRTKSTAVAPAEEVELCVGGKVFVIGTNSKTGRIRITLEV